MKLNTIGGRASCVAAARAGSLELAVKYDVAVPRTGAFHHLIQRVNYGIYTNIGPNMCCENIERRLNLVSIIKFI